MESTPPYAAMALAITSQDWTALGLDSDPDVAPGDDLEVTVERIVALLLVRIVAIHAPAGKFQDKSTSTICRTSLMASEPWEEPINEFVIGELKQYVHSILSKYKDIPYHNHEHAYHVTISANKLLDLALNSEIHNLSKTKPRLYGFDALMHLVVIFCAMIHDVEHQGIPNRQLALEDDELAILYNDQSIAENRSLTVAFRELLKTDYETLRKAMFVNNEEYRRFRKLSTQLVLQTDIASPERTQIRKSKWKEAFGEDFQTMEAKVKQELKRRSSAAHASQASSAVSILSELQQLPEIQDSLTNTPEDSENDEIEDYDKSIMHYKEKDKELQPNPGFSNRNPSIGTLSSISSIQRPNMISRSVSAAVRSSGSVPGDEALGYSDNFRKFQRRVSAAAGHQRRFRLGISRSIDLSGQFIETYTRRSTMSTHTHMQALEMDQEEEEDEYDDLKTSVIMEQILTAADISHVLQGWYQMEKFSNRLFLELKKAHSEGRGPHPKPNWYENQIAFLESYILPLGQRLEDLGIFGPLIGPVFARLVESNRDQWMVDGEKVTADIIAKGAELYPVEDD